MRGTFVQLETTNRPHLAVFAPIKDFYDIRDGCFVTDSFLFRYDIERENSFMFDGERSLDGATFGRWECFCVAPLNITPLPKVWPFDVLPFNKNGNLVVDGKEVGYAQWISRRCCYFEVKETQFERKRRLPKKCRMRTLAPGSLMVFAFDDSFTKLVMLDCNEWYYVFQRQANNE
jgi:hypothetical protein